MYVKVQHQAEIHLYKKKLSTMQALREYIGKTFHNLPQNYQIKYKDSDNDYINLSSDEDLLTLEEFGAN